MNIKQLIYNPFFIMKLKKSVNLTILYIYSYIYKTSIKFNVFVKAKNDVILPVRLEFENKYKFI